MSEGKSRRNAGIEDLLAEPIVRLTMKAYHFSEEELRGLLLRAADALGDLRPVRGDEADERSNDVLEYRRNVGVVLLNRAGMAFVGRRVDGLGWQMPQGGIEKDEEPRAAALRELREEIGTSNATLLAEGEGWRRYDLPAELVGRVWNGRWKGQEQKWLAMRFEGGDDEINVATEHPEFTEWRWANPAQLPMLAAAFKREIYSAALREFSAFLAGDAPPGTSPLNETDRRGAVSGTGSQGDCKG